jgi:hypothetical protein
MREYNAPISAFYNTVKYLRTDLTLCQKVQRNVEAMAEEFAFQLKTTKSCSNEKINEIERTRSPPRATSLKKLFQTVQ